MSVLSLTCDESAELEFNVELTGGEVEVEVEVEVVAAVFAAGSTTPASKLTKRKVLMGDMVKRGE